MSRFASVLLPLAFLVACTPAAQPAAPAPGNPNQASANQVFKIGRLSLPPSMSPESSFNEFFFSLYDTLTALGDNYEIQPAVASKWEYTGEAWRFTLRDDLTFWNGDKVTADDVVYSANLIAKTSHPSKNTLTLMSEAKKVNEKTVDIYSRTKDGMLPFGTNYLYIIQGAYYDRVGKDEFGQKPMASGPFEPVSYNVDTGAVIKKRSAEHPFRKVTATEIQFQVIPDVQQQVVGLRLGDIDLVVRSSFTSEQVTQLRNAGIETSMYEVGNITNGVMGMPEMKERNTPLQDKRVRQALNYAVNKEAIVTALFKDIAKPATQLTVAGAPSFDAHNKGYPYDPAKAKALLAEAGYPDGFKLPTGIAFSPSTVPTGIPTIVQDNLRAIGVEAAINSYENGILLDKYYGRAGQTKDDLLLQSSGDSNGTFSVARNLYTCDKTGPTRWWCNEEFDRLWSAASQEVDETKRNAMLKQAAKVLHDDVPTLLIVQRFSVTPYAKDVQVSNSPPALTYDSLKRIG